MLLDADFRVPYCTAGVFLHQVFNMFRKDGPCRDAIEKLVLSPRLAHVAAQLLGCKR